MTDTNRTSRSRIPIQVEDQNQQVAVNRNSLQTAPVNQKTQRSQKRESQRERAVGKPQTNRLVVTLQFNLETAGVRQHRGQ